MENELPWAKTLSPPSGGARRLSEKLRRSDERYIHEVRAWRAVAAAMIAIGPLVTLLNPADNDLLEFQKKLPQLPRLDEAQVADGQASLVPGTPSGVRFFWVFKN